MPKVTSHWTFHRYFPPLTCHAIFSPERGISPLPLTQHIIFPRDEVGSSVVREPAIVALSVPVSKVLIPKPRGEVSRINRGGYNLQEKLGWPPAEYEEIRVSLTSSRFRCNLLSNLAGFHHSSGSRASCHLETMEQATEGTNPGCFCKSCVTSIVISISNLSSR